MRAHVHPETIRKIIAHYKLTNEVRASEREWWTASGAPFSTVVARAAEGKLPNGKRHPHQRRLTKSAIEGCINALSPILDRLENSADFFQLWRSITGAYEGVRGAGELAAYDTADRIRHRLGLESTHLVYLHAGTRIGARMLAGGRLPKESGWAIQRWEVPEGLRVLDNHELEDVLCIYKGDLLLTPAELSAKWGRGREAICGIPSASVARC